MVPPIFRQQDEILAQGAMAVLSLSLDRSDVILNAYPFTSPIGLGDLASLMLRPAEAADRATLPLGAVHLGES